MRSRTSELMQNNSFSLTLEGVVPLSQKVKHFIFKADPPSPLVYLPGQFISIHFAHEGHALKRSYSIANPPCEDNRIEFAASYVANGPASELLFNLQSGDKLEATGPFGRLILKPLVPKRYLLIATGTGITPYRAMLPLLKTQLKENPELEIVILQGVQTQSDILYLEEFLTFAQACPRVRFQAHLSRATLPLDAPYLHAGYVQSAFPTLNLSPENDRVYLCGNPCMIDASFQYLKDAGFEVSQVVREKYFSNPLTSPHIPN